MEAFRPGTELLIENVLGGDETAATSIETKATGPTVILPDVNLPRPDAPAPPTQQPRVIVPVAPPPLKKAPDNLEGLY